MSIRSRLEAIESGKFPKIEVIENINDLKICDILIAVEGIYISGWYMEKGEKCKVVNKDGNYFDIEFNKNCLKIDNHYNTGKIIAEKIGFYCLKKSFKKVVNEYTE